MSTIEEKEANNVTYTTLEKADPRAVVYNCEHPEDSAMLQALMSRDPGSLDTRIEKLKKADSGKFMDKYYVGYGHRSIGDCAFVSIYIEDISLFATKMIEDHMRFNGQESSTRYIDFCTHGLTSYLDIDSDSKHDATRLIELYKIVYKQMYDHFALTCNDEKQIKPAAFDVARSVLPLGMKTNVVWTTTLTGFRDHLLDLAVHPLEEVRDVSKICWHQLKQMCPNSFAGDLPEHDPQFIDDDEYVRQRWISTPFYTEMIDKVNIHNIQLYLGENFCWYNLDKNKLKDEFIGNRLRWLDSHVGQHLSFITTLDFGSYRDLHRHRLAKTPICLSQFNHRTKNVIYPKHCLYYKAMDGVVERDVINEIREMVKGISPTSNEVSPYVSLYSLPLGVQIPAPINCCATELSYILFLRSKENVHPTLRRYIQNIYSNLDYNLKKFFTVNLSEPSFKPDSERAQETIYSRTVKDIDHDN